MQQLQKTFHGTSIPLAKHLMSCQGTWQPDPPWVSSGPEVHDALDPAQIQPVSDEERCPAVLLIVSSYVSIRWPESALKSKGNKIGSQGKFLFGVCCFFLQGLGETLAINRKGGQRHLVCFLLDPLDVKSVWQIYTLIKLFEWYSQRALCTVRQFTPAWRCCAKISKKKAGKNTWINSSCASE